MGQDDIRTSINGLTELDRLELEKIIGQKHLAITTQRTPDGHLGEPGSMTAMITIGIAALEVVGGSLALWLAKDRRKSLLKDEIEIKTTKGTIRRKLVIKSESSDAIPAGRR
jgi:hypothetical protein